MKGRTRPALVATALLALVALQAGCDVVFQGMHAEATDVWQRTYTLEEGGQIEVISPNGAIDVTPSADATTVEVAADRKARASSEQAAKDELKAIQITEQVTPKQIRLEVPRPPGGVRFGQASREVSFRLKVPRNAAVKVNTRNGAVHVTGLSGAVKADSSNGDIVGENLGGVVQIGTTNGSIKVHVTGIQADGIRLDTTNGNIDLRLPADAKANIAARWINGGFEATGLNPEGEKDRRRYEGKLNGGGPRIELNTTNGSIRISS
jgi:hypothetical protein